MKQSLQKMSLVLVFCMIAALVPLIGGGLTAYADGDFTVEEGVLTRYNGSAENVVIPSSVTGIGNRAFVSNKTMKSVVIPGSVTSIGDYAFSDCKSLKA